MPVPSVRIALTNGNGYVFKSSSDLMYCVADGSYCRLYFHPEGKYMSTKSLGKIEALISEANFIRIHKSHLVNMLYVKEVNNLTGHQVVMKNGEELTYSRNKKQEILDYFQRVKSE
ncbi:MAG: LytTR family transcriptional regulator [Saprospiraceae bacterium]|nr:LytTR family transcriptional regulator [Saprospiraceae bacterium]MCB9319679.1 LytTR family transcriptional regulator [Lewinellaceae bacterium]